MDEDSYNNRRSNGPRHFIRRLLYSWMFTVVTMFLFAITACRIGYSSSDLPKANRKRTDFSGNHRDSRPKNRESTPPQNLDSCVNMTENLQ